MDKVRVTELGYVGIGVSNPEAWKRFASEMMGMEWVEEGASTTLRMDYWHHRIAIHKDKSDDLLYAGYRVDDDEALDAMGKQLTQHGVKYKVASEQECDERHVLGLLKLEDPAGVPIEIFHGPEVNHAVPFYPGRRMHGKFKTGNLGMGHVFIRDTGDEKSLRFYKDVLGMKGGVNLQRPLPSGHKFKATFLYCNERQHTVAIGLGPAPKRIHHLMVEVENLMDVGIAYDMVSQAQIPLLIDIGKHAVDHMTSFYVQTPSGWYWEMGYQGGNSNAQSEFTTVQETWGHEWTPPDGTAH